MITTEDLALHAQWAEGSPAGKRLVRIGADLRGANLQDANLQDANLRGANLRGANLRGANLHDANLHDADLQDADLQDADLQDADLQDADLWGADLRGAIGLPIATDAPARLVAVARAALQPGALEMGDWHTCNTQHCMSGWAVHQAGEVGRILEEAVGNHLAGLYLLGPEAALHFYDSNEAATEFLRGVLAKAEAEGVA